MGRRRWAARAVAAAAFAAVWTGARGDAAACPLGWDYNGAAGWDNDTDPLLYHPRFHVMPPTRQHRPTGMNDYNAMFSFGGVYHFTYQDHINCPNDINQANQSFGHVVTSDLVHLVHLPPMLTDDVPYDNTLGPWDGPGFMCNGVPTVIYNSHAEGNSFGKQTKTMATPVDLGDASLSQWHRTPLSPSDAFIGPGTLPPPWQSADGAKFYAFAKPSVGLGCWLWETDAAGNCTAWRVATQNFTDPRYCFGNNPELWPLPKPCPGCPEHAAAGQGRPTHVLKYTAGEYDAYVLGVYDEAALYFTPTTASKLYEFPKSRQFEDGRGAWSESMLTIDGSRRFYLGWVPPGVSPGYTGPTDLPPNSPPLWHTSTVMREIFYDTRLEQLTFAPIAEYAVLRTAALWPALAGKTLTPGATPTLLGAARQFDLNMSFAFAAGGQAGGAANASFGVSVFAAADGTAGARVGVDCTTVTPPTELPGTDLPGADYHWFGVDPSFTPAECEAACRNDSVHCKAWTLVEGSESEEEGDEPATAAPGPYPPYRCCLKNAIPPSHPNPKCISGILRSGPRCVLTVNTTGSGDVPGHTVSSPVATVAAPVLPGESTVTLRVIGDRSIIEAFAMNGRAVATATVYAPAAHSTIAVWAAAGNVAVTGQGFSMGCAWVNPNTTKPAGAL